MSARDTAGVEALVAAGLAALVAALACAAPSPTWTLERAAAHRADGHPESALRHTEREILRSRRELSPEVAELHVSLLRELGRSVEAEAFAAFAARTFAGEHTSAPPRAMEGRDCSPRQPGFELIRSWGHLPVEGGHLGVPGSALPFPENVVVTFELDAEGRVRNIDVLRAGSPATAWRFIALVGSVKVSKRRLEEQRGEAPESFPIALCTAWNYERPKEFQPWTYMTNGAMRGIR